MNGGLNGFLNKIERKIGKYAVPQLTKYMILTYIVGYILYFIEMAGIPILEHISLSPGRILHGEIWRLFTWIFMPPSRPGIFTIIMLLFYYQIGTALEQTWGDFKYNLYIFSGLFFMVIGAFLVYVFGRDLDPSGFFTTFYINMSVFLAFAACYPDMQVMLYFLIPLKIKYLAFVDVAFLVYQAFVSGWAEKMSIIVSLLNFIIFFFTTRNYKSISPSERARKKNYKKAFERGPYYQGEQKRTGFGSRPAGGASSGAWGGSTYGASSGSGPSSGSGAQRGGTITKHRCAICGRTELDGDMLEFRFCSKCAGNYEYCQDHLFNHTHVKFGK